MAEHYPDQNFINFPKLSRKKHPKHFYYHPDEPLLKKMLNDKLNSIPVDSIINDANLTNKKKIDIIKQLSIIKPEYFHQYQTTKNIHFVYNNPLIHFFLNYSLLAAKEGNTELMHDLLIEISEQTNLSPTVIAEKHWFIFNAIKFLQVEVINHLTQVIGIDINFRYTSPSNKKFSPLSFAIKTGKFEAVKPLVWNGAEIKDEHIEDAEYLMLNSNNQVYDELYTYLVNNSLSITKSY